MADDKSIESKTFENPGLDVDVDVDESFGMEMKKMSKAETGRQQSVPYLFAQINLGNLEGVRQHLDQTTEHINSASYGGLTPLHACCHMQQFDILKLLIERGAMVDLPDSLGNSPLHVAVREAWSEGVKELLRQGASPSQISDPPSNVSGQFKETPLHSAIRTGNNEIFTELMKYSPDLSVRDRNNHSVFHLAAGTRNLVALRQLLMDPKCYKILETISQNTESLYHAALPSTAKVENEPQILKIIQLIYKSNDNLDNVNFLGESPLFLACRLGLPNVVNFFLSHGAEPTHCNREGQSTLHAACISGCSVTLENLLTKAKVQDLIFKPDNSGYKPFHYAVESASVGCCKTLVHNGEHLTNKGKNGISNCSLVLEKMPSAMQLFRDLFDAGVTMSKKSQFDPDFSITFDYSVLLSSERDDVQSSIASELAGTRLESLIKHPLLESFLCIKWSRIRNVFYLNVLQYFLYLILHSVFVLLTYGKREINWAQHHTWFMTFKFLHIILIVSISFPAIIMTIANLKKILMQWETYTRLIAMAASAYVVFITTEKRITSYDKTAKDSSVSKDHPQPPLEPERALASVAILFVWVELMMLLGRFPALGTYILMFTKVSKSLIKFIIAFLSLYLGFSMSFHILFHKLPVFEDYALSFAKTIMMSTGEIAYSEFAIAKEEKGMAFEYFCLTIMCFFVFMVTIIMSNLLIGLAVNDIPYLKRLGKIKRLVKQASYVVAYEKVLTFLYNTYIFPGTLRAFLSARNSINRVITLSPNKEHKRGKYSSYIKEETIKEAIALGSCNTSDDFQPNIVEYDVQKQFKNFHMRYSNDRRTQKYKFEELSIMCGDIKKDMLELQNKMDHQITKMSAHIDEQMKQNQTLLQKLADK